MAFYLYSGPSGYEYPALNLTATNGLVYDFGSNPAPSDGRWSSNAGPATGTTKAGTAVDVPASLPHYSGLSSARPSAAAFGEGTWYNTDLARLDLSNGTTWTNGIGGGSSGASSLVPTAVKTSAYSAAVGDLVPVDTTSGGVTITLPTAPADKSQVAVKHITRGGTNTVTIALGGSDVINKTGGSTTGTLTLLNQSVILQYKATGAIWYVVDDSVSLSQLDARYDALGAASAAVAGLAPLASPALTGNPTVPTQSVGDNSTKAASTAYVDRVSGQTVVTKVNTYTANAREVVLADGTQRGVNDGTTTNGSANLGSATASFVASDVGRAVSGTGIPNGTTIASVTSGTVAVMSANATATGSGVPVTIGGGFTVTLPAAAVTNRVTVKKVDFSSTAITVTPASGTIEGATSLTITGQFQSRDLVSDGTNWSVV